MKPLEIRSQRKADKDDLFDIRPLRASSGLFDLMSLHTYFDADYDTLAMTRATGGPAIIQGRFQGLTADQKIFVHEMTHYWQTVTTPVGLFISRVQSLQSSAIIYVLEKLVSHGIEPRNPLRAFVQKLAEPLRSELQGQLDSFIVIEALLRTLIGDEDRYDKLLPLIQVYNSSLSSPLMLLRKVETWLREVWGAPAPGEKDFDVSHSDAASRLEWVLRKSTGINLLSLIEGMATAAEFWRSNIALADLKHLTSRQTVAPEYWNALAWFLSSTDGWARTTEEVIVSFLSICELTLMAPILHEHSSSRRFGNVNELLPIHRFWFLMLKAKAVRPARGISDAHRFVQDLCAASGFAAPGSYLPKYVDTCLANNGDRNFRNSAREDIYQRSIVKRSERWTSFIDFDLALFGPIDAVRSFSLDFFPPVMVYKRRVFTHHDQEFLSQSLWNWGYHNILRSILFEKKPSITFPYPTIPHFREWFSGVMNGGFEAKFGFTIPQLRFNGPDF